MTDPQPAGAGMSPADVLRVAVHRHLRQYPRLTLHEIARALKVSETRVRRLLPKMEADGEAVRETGPKSESDARPVTRWTAT